MSIKGAFLDMTGLRDAVQSASREHKRLAGEVESLKRRREDIANAVANRADLIAAAENWADGLASAYFRTLETHLSQVARLGTEVETALTAASGRPWQNQLLGLDTSPHQRPASEQVPAGALIAMVGADTVKAALRRVIAGMKIDNEGLPVAQRRTELATLDNRIGAAEKQLEAMRREAAKNGVRFNLGVQP